MAFAADLDVLFDRLDEDVRGASEPAPNLFCKIIASACTRVPILSKAGKTAGIEQLIETGAWTDAALLLVELELPGWRLRRLVRENAEWLCSLSRQPDLPMELDDTADASHEALPLAILQAFIQARRASTIVPVVQSAVPHVHPVPVGTVCCENFG